MIIIGIIIYADVCWQVNKTSHSIFIRSHFWDREANNQAENTSLLSLLCHHHCRLIAWNATSYHKEDECQGKPPNLFPRLEKAQHLLNPDQKEPAHPDCRSAESSGFPSWQLATQPGGNLALPEQAWRQQRLQLGVRTSRGSPPPSVFSHQLFLLKPKKNQCGLFSPGPETRSQLTSKIWLGELGQLMLRTHLCYFQSTRNFFFF